MNLYQMLSTIPDFSRNFPHPMQEVKKGNVWAYDSAGYTRECTEEELAHIKELEKSMANYHAKVYCVIRSTSDINGEKVNMVCYPIVSDDVFDISEYANGVFYAMADVINTSWDIHEMGSILIKECVGRLIRVG